MTIAVDLGCKAPKQTIHQNLKVGIEFQLITCTAWADPEGGGMGSGAPLDDHKLL